jgi:hypothetical protein
MDGPRAPHAISTAVRHELDQANGIAHRVVEAQGDDKSTTHEACHLPISKIVPKAHAHGERRHDLFVLVDSH